MLNFVHNDLKFSEFVHRFGLELVEPATFA